MVLPNQRLQIVVSILFLICSTHQIIGGDASEESLIKAWEQLQRSDPKTEVFEKIKKNHYRFHTDHFPFKGELLVLNVIIEEYPPSGGMDDWLTGVLEVELLNLPEDFQSKHSYSYSRLETISTLYFDPEQSEWISSKEWLKKMSDGSVGGFWPSAFLSLLLGNWFWIFFLIIILVFLAISSRRIKKTTAQATAQMDEGLTAQERAEEQVKQSLELQKEQNHILNEILQVLKSEKN